MTRKKWNRLRRTRPELFKQFDSAGWEQAFRDIPELVRVSKPEAVALLTAAKLTWPERPNVPD
jgi:hypothetical protein